MNTGIIASRYAKAFLEYVTQEGAGENVYSQACALVHMFSTLEQFKEYVESPSDISVDRKTELLTAALGSPVDPAIVSFLKMVTAHRRTEFFPRMLLSFIEQYRKQNDIMVGRLVSAVPIDGLRQRLEDMFHDRTGAQVHLEENIDSSLVGGFVFELDGYRLDASVESHLERLRRQIVEKNNRIV